MQKVTLRISKSTQDFEIGRDLFKQYADSLGFDLDYQNFDEELNEIHIQYGYPEGVLIIAYVDDEKPVGCCGVRKLQKEYCELKRMYVLPKYRGCGIGRKLLEFSVLKGIELGYRKMRLDTLDTMEAALHLYKRYGFYEIDAYRYNPNTGTVYLERDLMNEVKDV